MALTAYMIMDFDNPVSIEYSEKSFESFQHVSDLIRIEPFQCTVPSDLIFDTTGRKDEWGFSPFLEKSVVGMDLTFPEKVEFGKKDDYSRVGTSQEKAALISHLRLLQTAARTKDRIFVLEHDAYLKDQDAFRRLFDVYFHKSDYFNVGIAVECYSLSNKFASWMVDNHNTTMLEGPMGFLHRHYKTFSEQEYAVKGHLNNKDRFVVEEYSERDKLVYVVAGQTNQTYVDMSVKYHFPTKRNTAILQRQNKLFKAPVTQIVAKNLGVTINHTSTADIFKSPNLHIVDSLSQA